MGNGGAQISLLGGFGSHFLAKIETVIPLERSIKSGYRNGNFHGRSKEARYFFPTVINVGGGGGYKLINAHGFRIIEIVHDYFIPLGIRNCGSWVFNARQCFLLIAGIIILS